MFQLQCRRREARLSLTRCLYEHTEQNTEQNASRTHSTQHRTEQQRECRFQRGSTWQAGLCRARISDQPSLQHSARISEVMPSGNRCQCSFAAMSVSTIFLALAITAEYIVANTVVGSLHSRCDALDERNLQLVHQMIRMVGISTTMKQWRLSACSSPRPKYYPVCRKTLTWSALLGLLPTMTLEARSLYSTLHHVTLLLSSSLGMYASGRKNPG